MKRLPNKVPTHTHVCVDGKFASSIFPQAFIFNFALQYLHLIGGFLVAQMVKDLPTMQETQVQFLAWEDPLGEGNGNPFQYSCLENSMDRKAWPATVHGIAKSQIRD